jgi:hypothetical protein
MPAAFPDFSWFVRAMRLPIVACAVLAGGVIGGVSVYAIDSALAPLPMRSADATSQPSPPVAQPQAMNTGARQKAPNAVRIIDDSGAHSTIGAAAAPPQPNVSNQAAQMQPPATWPDALSRSHGPAADSASVTPSATPPMPAAPVVPVAPAKQRVVTSRPSQSAAADFNSPPSNSRKIYDYYRGGDTAKSKTRLVGQRQPLKVAPRPEPFWGAQRRDDDSYDDTQ